MSKVLVWAHRGASGTMPENTLPAFHKAAQLGADAVELDIQLIPDVTIIARIVIRTRERTAGRYRIPAGAAHDHSAL